MVQVMHERPATWKKLSAVSQASRCPGELAVRQLRSYHLNDEDETEVEPDNIAKGKHSPLTSAPGVSLLSPPPPQGTAMARAWCPSQRMTRPR